MFDLKQAKATGPRARGAAIDGDEATTESRSVAAGGATAARAMLELGIGELAIGGGATDLLEATFAYTVPAWRPELAYAVRERAGLLALRQPEGQRPPGRADARNAWDLRFADDLPLDLGLKLGMVEGRLDLGRLSLDGLHLEVGSGNLTLDLSETRARTLRVPIRAGVLNLTLIVPADTGAQVEVRSPVLTVHAKGWQRARHIWVNDAYGATPETLRIAIDSGVASITLAQQLPASRLQPVGPLLH